MNPSQEPMPEPMPLTQPLPQQPPLPQPLQQPVLQPQPLPAQPSVQPISAQPLPQQPAPVYQQPLPPQQYSAQQPTMQPQNILSYNSVPKKNKIFLPIMIIGGILVLSAIVFGVLAVLGSTVLPTYSASSTTTYSGSSLSFSYPKQWNDISAEESVKKNFIDTPDIKDLDADDVKVFAYKYNKETETSPSLAFVVVGKSGITKAQLAEIASDTEIQQLMRESLDSLTLVDMFDKSKCKEITNQKTEVSFNTTNFPMQLDIRGDCVYNDAMQAKTGTTVAHLTGRAGFRGDKLALLYVLSVEQDWVKNQGFYQSSVIDSLKVVEK